jgi:hypothetical protein
MGKAIKFEFGFHGMISVPPTEEYQMDLSETFIFGNNSPSREEEEEGNLNFFWAKLVVSQRLQRGSFQKVTWSLSRYSF